jgi:hypothetical protein
MMHAKSQIASVSTNTTVLSELVIININSLWLNIRPPPLALRDISSDWKDRLHTSKMQSVVELLKDQHIEW